MIEIKELPEKELLSIKKEIERLKKMSQTDISRKNQIIALERILKGQEKFN